MALSATSSSLESSFPTEHCIIGLPFVIILMVFCSFSYNGFRLAFGGTTQPIFGLGIFPLGPKTLPNVAATFGIIVACATKKSCLFASFLISLFLLNFAKSSTRINSSAGFAWLLKPGSNKGEASFFFTPAVMQVCKYVQLLLL